MPDKTEMRTMAFPASEAQLRVVEEDGAPPKIAGYAAVFNRDSVPMGFGGSFVEQIAPGAFKDVLASEPDVRALFNHNPDNVLGRTKSGTLTLTEDATGLFMEITPPDTQDARDLMTKISRGDIDGQSFAFRIGAETWAFTDDDTPDRSTIEQVSALYDVGPVVYPAYPDTGVQVKRSYEEARAAWEAEQAPVPGTPNRDACRVKLARRRAENNLA